MIGDKEVRITLQMVNTDTDKTKDSGWNCVAKVEIVHASTGKVEASWTKTKSAVSDYPLKSFESGASRAAALVKSLEDAELLERPDR